MIDPTAIPTDFPSISTHMPTFAQTQLDYNTTTIIQNPNPFVATVVPASSKLFHVRYCSFPN